MRQHFRIEIRKCVLKFCTCILIPVYLSIGSYAHDLSFSVVEKNSMETSYCRARTV